ncbi:uncharacterized protein BJX67DRAFT_384191 [Aspergillus lucknowensis]|uniref:Uncharacterized protein n=1 Tax=Aspergillus lucknowensis TaxID=176173 RepID=A0ABR4LHU5_9EURO
MKTSIVAAIAALAGLSAASPIENRQFQVSVTLWSARNITQTLSIPADRTPVQIDSNLVVTRITSPGGGFCTFVGTEGESVVIYGEDDQSLRVPQPIEWGTCGNN